MDATAERQLDTRVSNWTECVGGPWYPDLAHGGFVSYRIWQQFDGLRWFQRHEWKRADGSVELQDWINGVTGWCPGAAKAEGSRP